jgi:hypothetical protein
MRAVDLEVAVIMCGTGLGALLSSPATAVVKLTKKHNHTVGASMGSPDHSRCYA